MRTNLKSSNANGFWKHFTEKTNFKLIKLRINVCVALTLCRTSRIGIVLIFVNTIWFDTNIFYTHMIRFRFDISMEVLKEKINRPITNTFVFTLNTRRLLHSIKNACVCFCVDFHQCFSLVDNFIAVYSFYWIQTTWVELVFLYLHCICAV